LRNLKKSVWESTQRLKSSVIAFLSRRSSSLDREFLFPNEPIIGTTLTSHPLVVFLSLSIGCSSILLLPAWWLNLLSIPVHFPNCPAWHSQVPSNSQTNVGILYKWNWSVGYSVLVPLIFSLAAIACRSIRRSLAELVEEGTVQPDRDNKNGDPDSFIKTIATRMAPWNGAIFRGSVLLAVLACIGAGYSNFLMYMRVFASGSLTQWYEPCQWDDLDWMHGWTIPGHQGAWFHMTGNFVLYLVAQVVQGFVIFLACYFVLKFLSLTQSFASVIIEDGSGFHFEPFISDPDKCLGLRPIGRLFSTFLLLSIVFQIFAFGLRLQQILIKEGWSLFSYFSAVATNVKDLSKDANDAATAVHALFRLSGFDTLNSGLVETLILMIIPMSVIAWWPIVRLRNYVAFVRQKQLRVFRIEEQQARQTQKYDTAKHIADDMEKLTKASIWPNGFKVGWGSFFFLFALLVSTIAPPLIVPLVSGGIGLKILNKITSD
jgi:hypothetical protein